MPGAMPGDEEVGGAHVAVEQVVEGRLVEIRRRAEPRGPGVVDQDVDDPDLVDQGSHRGHVVEVGGHESCPPPCVSISRTTSAPRSGLRPWTTTSQPSRASRSAVARPMPEVAPVTRAVPNPVAVLLLAALMTLSLSRPVCLTHKVDRSVQYVKRY